MAQISELFRHTVYEMKIVQEIPVMRSKDMVAVLEKVYQSIASIIARNSTTLF